MVNANFFVFPDAIFELCLVSKSNFILTQSLKVTKIHKVESKSLCLSVFVRVFYLKRFIFRIAVAMFNNLS